MDLIDNLWLGFTVAVTWVNLLFCLIGVLVGTLIGVLPGLGPVTTIAMLLPITYYLEPVTALIMLAGIFYGSQYGGSTTSILLNMPGEASSVVTCLDGHQMAKNGRAGAALAVAAIGSFIGGTVATLIVAGAAIYIADFVKTFTSVEYFSLMVFGLVAAVVLASGSVLNAIGMVLIGLFLGMVGTDLSTGAQRYVFGVPMLADGIDFVILATGMFGVAEVLANLERRIRSGQPSAIRNVGRAGLTRAEWKQSAPAIWRGTLIGSALGVLPGSGGMLSSFASYTLEKKLAKDPSRFGKGAIEGVAGPESANNAGSQTSFIPLLTMGLPSNATMAMMAGAMMIHGIVPSSKVVTDQPELFWGLIASMWIGNVLLLIMNLPLVGIWIRILEVPYRLLYPTVLLLCCIGVYSLTNSPQSILFMLGFGLLGWMFMKFGCEPAPLVLGFVLGSRMEENLRRAMLVSGGDAWVFLQRPISLVFLVCAALLLILVVLPSFNRSREALKEG
ncbi:MAG: tripartite tricarboxylate transporter permease [bacterium]|jgi:TctA family transporter|nr:tripartite tricarboxylate transporter permease [Betaproteobacteria bacterium]